MALFQEYNGLKNTCKKSIWRKTGVILTSPKTGEVIDYLFVCMGFYRDVRTGVQCQEQEIDRNNDGTNAASWNTRLDLVSSPLKLKEFHEVSRVCLTKHSSTDWYMLGAVPDELLIVVMMCSTYGL